MKSLPKFLVLALLLTAIYACSSIKVEHDYSEKADFSKLSSYAWQSDKQKPTGDARVDNSLLNTRIREAINNHLSGIGHLQSSRKKADYLVAYHYTMRVKEEDRVRTGFSIGSGSRGRHGGVGIGIGLGHSNQEYDTGELIIDIIDPVSSQILWRGAATRKVLSQLSPTERTARINETVKAILRKFPPK